MFQLSPSTMTHRERREAIYSFQPLDHFPRREFYFWPETIERWKGEGLPEDWQESNFFGFDEEGSRGPGVDLGWTETPLRPGFAARVVEETAEYQVVQDSSGRIKRIFRDLPTLAMPTYLQHAVASRRDWEEQVKWRLDPADPARWEAFEAGRGEMAAASAGGKPPFWVVQGLIGGYMYLRNMFGPEGILYAFYDLPELVREMMETWFSFMDYSLARVQGAYALDEIAMAEDICYKAGMLISPAVWREFLRPYYEELIRRAKGRQGGEVDSGARADARKSTVDRERPVYFMLDTDGNADEANPLYHEIGFDATSPCEVASGQDVVAIGERYPDLVIFGGLDKRLITAGADLAGLDRELERILPTMLRRGGYAPTTDHGVPPDVPLKNYLHYREKILELDH